MFSGIVEHIWMLYDHIFKAASGLFTFNLQKGTKFVDTWKTNVKFTGVECALLI